MIAQVKKKKKPPHSVLSSTESKMVRLLHSSKIPLLRHRPRATSTSSAMATVNRASDCPRGWRCPRVYRRPVFVRCCTVRRVRPRCHNSWKERVWVRTPWWSAIGAKRGTWPTPTDRTWPPLSGAPSEVWRFRERSGISLWKNTYRAISWEPGGLYCYSTLFRWDQKGAVAIDFSTAMANLCFNNEILLRSINGLLALNWRNVKPNYALISDFQ